MITLDTMNQEAANTGSLSDDWFKIRATGYHRDVCKNLSLRPHCSYRKVVLLLYLDGHSIVSHSLGGC